MGEPINWMKQGLAETGFVEGRDQFELPERG